MGRFTEKQLTIMTIVVSVVITGLFAALIYKDLGAKSEEDQRIESLKGRIQVCDREIQRMPAREQDVIVYREIVKRDSAILPDESEINEFINVIGDFEKQSRVVVTQIQGLSRRGRSKRKEAIIKIPLKLKLRGSMDQFLKFVNSFENYDRFVRISAFQITAGRGKDEDGNIQHEITLELETYQYNPGGGEVVRVEIPNFEQLKQDIAIQKRIRQEKPAHIEKYLLKPRIGRRDPLVDPREPARQEGADEANQDELWKRQIAILDRLSMDVTLLRDDVRVEEKLRAENNFIRIASVSTAIDQRIAQLDFQISKVLAERSISIPELHEEFIAKVVKPYEEIKEKRKTAPEEILVDRRQVFEMLQKLKEKFAAQDYKEVMNYYEGFMRLSQGRKFAEDAEPLRQEMEKLAAQAQVISKFESEPLEIQGVIIDEKHTSYAIINKKIVSEGDNVDADGKIKIREIRVDAIEFIYENVPIVKPLRGK